MINWHKRLIVSGIAAGISVLTVAGSVCEGSPMKLSSVRRVKALQQANFRVYGYWPGYIKQDGWRRVKTEFLTDVVYLAGTTNKDGSLSSGGADFKFLKNITRAGKRKKFKVHYGIGGWGQKERWLPTIKDKKKREKLAKDLENKARTLRLDGINLDWEYPETKDEKEGYSKLIADLNRRLKRRKMEMTTAVMQRKPMLTKEGFEQDAVLVMTYDFQPVNSPMDKVQNSINFWQGQTKKLLGETRNDMIVMGLPFYGRSLKKWSKSKSYQTILKENKVDEKVNEVSGVAFDNIEKIQAKVKWAVEQDLKGVMIWQLDQDASGERSLLRAIYTQILRSKRLPDLNLDGNLDKGDLLRYKRYWGEETLGEENRKKAWAMGDINFDGKVDIKDIEMFKESWPKGFKAVRVTKMKKPKGE